MLTKMLANGSQRVFLNRVDELANRSLRAVENPTFLGKIDIRHYTTTTLRYVSEWRMSILLRMASAAP